MSKSKSSMRPKGRPGYSILPTHQAGQIGERDNEADRSEDLLDIPLVQPSDRPQLAEPSLFKKIVLIITNTN